MPDGARWSSRGGGGGASLPRGLSRRRTILLARLRPSRTGAGVPRVARRAKRAVVFAGGRHPTRATGLLALEFILRRRSSRARSFRLSFPLARAFRSKFVPSTIPWAGPPASRFSIETGLFAWSRRRAVRRVHSTRSPAAGWVAKNHSRSRCMIAGIPKERSRSPTGPARPTRAFRPRLAGAFRPMRSSSASQAMRQCTSLDLRHARRHIGGPRLGLRGTRGRNLPKSHSVQEDPARLNVVGTRRVP